MDAAFKVPLAWRQIRFCDRPALYPALHLRWAGQKVAIGREVPTGQWATAPLRVLVVDEALASDERELLQASAARGRSVLVLPVAGLAPDDRALVDELGFAVVSLVDRGPLATPAPHRPGRTNLVVDGCAVRRAEDMALLAALGIGDVGNQPDERAAATTPGARPPRPRRNARTVEFSEPYLVAACESLAAFRAIAPALERWRQDRGGQVLAVSHDLGVAAEAATAGAAMALNPADPALPELISEAEAFLCLYPDAPPDSPRPGLWTRSALFQGAPVIAASHPSIDGLAHLVVLDDWERGLKLYRRFPIERLKAIVMAQAFLAERLEPQRIAEAWQALASPPVLPRATARAAAAPLLLVLFDVFGDVDLMLPVLQALRSRGEVRLRIIVSDWLAERSPRSLNELEAVGLGYEVLSRDKLRAGEVPAIDGVDGVLTGADTTTRAQKAGHTLTSRARAKGAASFTLQHGFENIGLTYKDHLHGEDIAFASQTIFTWSGPEALAEWAAPETRAAAVPIGCPKAAPPPSAAAPLNQGHWPRIVGVFENLHWHRFDEDYRARLIADLEAAAAAHEDTLFLVKPHHAGRWASTNRDRFRQSANLVIVDPTDSAWEPHTAPALMAGMDAVLTTPSTVALDAARTGRPVAVLGYGLDLPLYQPLPIIRSAADLETFLAADEDAALLTNEAFLKRATLPGRADHRIAAEIARRIRERLPVRRAPWLERVLARPRAP